MSRPPILKLLVPVTARSGLLLCKKKCSHSIRMAHGKLCACLRKRRQSAVSGSSKERRVYLLASLRGLRQG